jgi:hypothetical protein
MAEETSALIEAKGTRKNHRHPIGMGSGGQIAAPLDIDPAEPWLDLLSFELGSGRLDELLVFRAVRKEDFHTVAPDPLDQIIAMGS